MKEAVNSIYGFLLGPSGQLNIYGKLLRAIIIFILMKIVIKFSYSLIDRFFTKRHNSRFKIEERKSNTLAVILKSVSKYLFYFIGIVSILKEFGLPIESILATAGIGGLAIGFGAQSLVKDIITGFFILFEDQYSVGDYIKTGDFDGIVEEIGIRITKIRAFSGELHIVPNGNIQTVTNLSRGSMRSLVNVEITYEEDIDKALVILSELSKKLSQENDNIVEGPTVLGVTNLSQSGIQLTVVAKTKPMEQWAVEREIRKKIKEEFHKAGIEIPYPRRVVIEKDKVDKSSLNS
ncbi:mechanosensitive ion channel family protein [Proteiniborus sp. MB09-C3]|uniref:mechanosensitive ion channel family protein n=1 Tax=Proteiniborus sp. MB09-C3 TaxID=3050072 RepID=UPI0025565B7D|nr:mechanosensitive ion channel family protein [Proteiniborus sp. MB09-C3]WIV12529.1 mechanosensitive ion channel family protein [Proteiniborus sp. MB09-C3]